MNVGAVSSSPIPSLPLATPASEGVSRSPGGAPFSQMMTRLLHEADRPQQDVIQSMDKLIAGEADNLHEIAISVAKADVSFRLVMEVRDKLINAYQEVMRMQV